MDPELWLGGSLLGLGLCREYYKHLREYYKHQRVTTAEKIEAQQLEIQRAKEAEFEKKIIELGVKEAEFGKKITEIKAKEIEVSAKEAEYNARAKVAVTVKTHDDELPKRTIINQIMNKLSEKALEKLLERKQRQDEEKQRKDEEKQRQDEEKRRRDEEELRKKQRQIEMKKRQDENDDYIEFLRERNRKPYGEEFIKWRHQMYGDKQ